MPDYRKLHNAAGHSQKVASLTDFEFRVWCQYRASADDFGVCPLLPAKLQGDNRRLASEPASKVMKALKRLIEVGLVVPFVHQGQTYICQTTWQDYEDLRYPRKTTHPAPPLEIFPQLSGKTSELFLQHHGNISEEFQRLARAGARETQTLTQTQTQTPTPTPFRGEGPGEGAGGSAWSTIVAALQVNDHSRAVWFAPCVPLREYQDRLVIGVPSPLFLEWLPKHYGRSIADASERVANSRRVDFELLKGEARRAS